MKVPDRAIGHRMPMSVHIKSCFKKLSSMLLVLDDCQDPRTEASEAASLAGKRPSWWLDISFKVARQATFNFHTLDDRTSLAGPAMMGGSAEQVLIAPLSGQN